MALIQPILGKVDSYDFSYPINSEYPNSISFSGVHAGLLIAYGSSNLIIVLIEGKYIAAVLRGHTTTVCTVSFEMRAPHILSCDISGNCYIWQYQDNFWQNTRIEVFPTPLTSITWYSARRELSYSSQDGLFYNSITNFGKNPEKLSNKSCFCTFNYDGSLLASHNRKFTVSIFMFQPNPYLTQVVKHPAPIISFDFHPFLPSFLTITKDYVLRIWRQSVLSTFSCTAAIKVPFIGYFVRQPSFFNNSNTFSSSKPAKILFIDQNNKRYKLKIDENGIIKNSDDGAPFRRLPHQPDIGLRAAYKTNLGTELVLVNKSKLSVVTRDRQRNLLYHYDVIQHASFAPNSFWLYTLDKSNVLIIWPIFNQYLNSKTISTKCELAVWQNSTTLIFIENSELKSFNTETMELSSIDFPVIQDVQYLYSKNEEIFVITEHSIISQSINAPIDSFKFAAFSKPYNNEFLIVFSNDQNQLKIIQCPSMKEIKAAERPNIEIKSIGVISFLSFAILTDYDLEFWNYSNNTFECQNKIYLPNMNGLYCDCSAIGGKIFCFDNSRLFSVLNGVTPYLATPNITGVVVNDVGHIAVFYSHYFKVYPSWCIDQPKLLTTVNPNLSQSNQLLNVGNLPPDAKFLQKLTEPTTVNYMISPNVYINPTPTLVSTIQATLFHLLECSIITNLTNCNPEQIPAIPNQYAIPAALEFPDDFKHTEYIKLIQQIKNVKEDIDMLGLRYLLAIKETAWPPSYFALWLSYSKSQSQIAEHLYSYIDANMLSKFYIPISIHQHSILVKIVQKSLQKMWASVQKVENVALLYVALGQNSSISKLYTAIGDDNRADFFKHDFKIERWRKCAIKNAYSSLSHHNFEMCAALFLVAGEVKSSLNVILNKLEDPILGFLVLRLITHSDYNHPDMKSFLHDWKSDEVMSVLISNLLQNDQAPNILKNLLLEKEFIKQTTVFGDRRIALFELYSYLTKDTSIATQIIMNLNQDGLAPLSQYITGIINSPYETFRPVGLQNSTEIEESDQMQESSLYSKPTIEIAKEFDFGCNAMADDNWSDEYSDEEISEKEEIIEVKNEGKVKNELNIFDLFLNDEISSLCSFFFNKEKEDIQNEDAGLFAMKNASITTASLLLGKEKRNLLLKFISQFLDNCSILYYKSALIPITSKKMLDLALKLYNTIIRFSQNESKQFVDSLDLKKILLYKDNEYIYSVFNAAIVVSLWTYFTQFLAQLLDDSIDPVPINKDKIPQETSYFDADLTSPKFPDWLPLLLSRYSAVKPGDPASLERARLLIMLLIFQKIYQITKELLTGETNNQFLEKMARRQKSMHKTLQFYEIALGSPPFTKSLDDLVNDKTDAASRLTAIIDKELSETFNQLNGIQKSSLSIQSSPPIYRNGEIMTKDRIEIKSKAPDYQFSSIKSMALMPLKKGNIVAIADNNLIKIDITNQSEPVFQDFYPKFHPESSLGPTNNTQSSSSQSTNNQNKAHAPPDAFAVIPHPNYDLFICLSPTEAYLYDFEQGKTDFKIYISPSQYKISCAAFSPNSTKLAIGTSILDIFSFDLSKWETNPTIKCDMKGPITALSWINSDTMIAVAYTNQNNQSSSLVIVNTLIKYHQPMEMKKEWGIISCIKSVTRKEKLVFGTKNGFVVVTNMRANYEVECIISLAVPIISLSNFQDIIGFGTGNGHLVLFSITHPKNTFKYEAPNKINSVIITDHMFLAGGDYSNIAIWNALEY